MSELNGVLPVDKPTGPTSHDVVATARRQLGLRRIGHTGTLDPFASGLLLLCLGPSTRLAEYLTGLPKSYVATLHLGVVTDTDDLEGTVMTRVESLESVTPDRLERALDEQRGEILQVPPRFSAKKVGGRKLYEAARAGEEVEIQPSRVQVTRLVATRFEPPEVDIEVDCSSGTYIRALARDIGERLGVGAHLTALRRTRIGRFDVEQAIGMEQLTDPAAVSSALLSPAEALGDMPAVTLPESERSILAHGGSVPAPEGTPEDGPLALLAADGALMAIGERRGSRIQPRKVFA